MGRIGYAIDVQDAALLALATSRLRDSIEVADP
jgi:hypothetical protein